MISLRSTLFAAAVCLFSLTSAQAAVLGTANVAFSGFLTVTNYDSSYLNGVRQTNNVGTYSLAFTNPTGKFLDLTSPLVGMCIEMQEAGVSTPYAYSMTKLEDGQLTAASHGPAVTINSAKANAIREYWGRFYDDSWSSNSLGYTPRYTAMLFNIGLYEIFYDYAGSLASLDLSDGLHTIGAGLTAVPSADYTTIENWFSQLNGDTSKFADLVLLVNSGKQDYITELSPTNIPEPATAVMMLLGTGMMFWKRRRNA